MDLQPRNTVATKVPLWRQFRLHLILSYIAIAIFPITIYQLLVTSQTRAELENQVKSRLGMILDMRRDQIAHWLSDSSVVLTNVVNTSHKEELIRYLRSSEHTSNEQIVMNTRLREAINATGLFNTRMETLFVYNRNGKIIAASNNRLVGQDVSQQPYFEPSFQRDYRQAPYYPSNKNLAEMTMTTRIRDSNGTVVGVLAAHVDLYVIQKEMEDRIGLGETGETYLVDKQDSYLLSPSRFESFPQKRIYTSEGIKAALAGVSGSGTYKNYRNEQVLGVYTWVPELNAGLVAEMSTDEAFGSLNRLLRSSLLLLLVVGFTALAIGLFVASRLSQPITKLTQVASTITNGDLSQRANININNEIGLLATSFNIMTSQLQQNVQTLEQRVASRTAELEQALASRSQTLAELQESINAQRQLEQTILELSSPVLPVLDRILVMPLIGVIDTARADQLLSSLMTSIEQQQAKIAIIDITGVPLVDTQIARMLMMAADAARLLGAEPILVGIRPELAQVIVSLGLDLSGLRTQADLQSAIEYAIKRQYR